MSTVVNLSNYYAKCLPNQLAARLAHSNSFFEIGGKVVWNEKTYGIKVIAHPSTTSVVIRVIEGGVLTLRQFHEGSRSLEKKLQVSKIDSLGVESNNSIPYNAEDLTYLMPILEGKVQEKENPISISDEAATRLMPWIRDHKLQDICEELTGREFTIIDPPFTPGPTHSSFKITASTVRRVLIFMLLCLVAVAVYKIFTPKQATV